MPNMSFFDSTNLEESGNGGYTMYRIPGIVVSGTGTVLAYYLARIDREDYSRQDIYLRRSTDNGNTWESRRLLVEGSTEESLHNAVMIAGKNSNGIHFIWHKNHNRCFYRKSTDDGLTWSETKEITHVYEKFKPEYNWNAMAAGPGHGIQLRNGRLVLPVWMSTGGNTHRPSVVSCIYSDDHGETWERGEIIQGTQEFVNPSETSAVELEDGSILLSMRHESNLRCRAVSTSTAGMKGWSSPRFDRKLPDPICFGSIARLAEKEKQGFDGILFSNCAWEDLEGLKAKMQGKGKSWSDDARRNLTVRLSTDEGHSWKYSRLLEEYGGYSDLSVSTDGKTIFCFYEKEWMGNVCINTKCMAMARFNIEWITKGELEI